MEFLVELVLNFLGEIVLQILAELALELGFESIREPFRKQGDSHPAVVGIGLAFLGAIAGGLTVLILPRPVTPPLPIRGLSLLLSPLATGVLMDRYGEWRKGRTGKRTYMATFWGGALFAFAMAATRLVLLR